MTFIELKATHEEIWVENTDTNTTYGFAIRRGSSGQYALAPLDAGSKGEPITPERSDEAEAAKLFAETVVKRMQRDQD